MMIIIFILLMIFFLLTLIYYRKNDTEIISATDILLNTEELEAHAIEVARNHITHKKRKSTSVLLKRLDYNYKHIVSIYKDLRDTVQKNISVPPASEWLLDNFYIIEEQVKEIKQNITQTKFLKLNVLDKGYLKGYPRVYALALELISHTDGRLDEGDLEKFVKAYQTRQILSIAEVWSLSLMIRMALIEYIKNICEKINEIKQQWIRVEELTFDNPDLLDIIREDMEKYEGVNVYFVERLFKKIRKEGIKQGEILEYIDKKIVETGAFRDRVIEQVHKEQAAQKISIGNAFTSLKLVSALDWNELFENLSVVENILRDDPVNVYSQMDFESRDYYRQQIEKIALMCKTTEIKVAKKIVEYAQKAFSKGKDERLSHVGYYIMGKGRNKLISDLGCGKSNVYFHNYPFSIYILPIAVLTLFIAGLMANYAYVYSDNIVLTILTGFAVLIPASDISLAIVNWVATHIVPPTFLPKLEYKEGIPEDASTLVIIPTLLPNEETVVELIEKLEVYYHANKENNVYFALVGDFKDAENKELPDDNKIIQTAIEGIRKLNNKYKKDRDIFYFFHRHRQYSEKQRKWMGWERKRGALVELNMLLQGSENTSYSIIEGDISNIQNKIKYVITIDRDTKLTIGNAKKLIGTISHPLNKGILDNKKEIVTEGYGIIQPRIGIDIESTNSSMFTRIFAGQGGIDPYTTAYSDVYQDLFGEGIFTGKGIYDVNIFNKVLKDAIPENVVLSHDLLEGSYIRTGLATDIELIDGYPAKYSSFIMRLHRWVRGDWQLIKWLYSKNPLSILSKWKILDNLRRSLVTISLTFLLTLGVTILPGNPLVWIGFAIISLGFPLVVAFADYVINKYYKAVRERLNGNLICGFRAVLYQVLLNFLFLPYTAYMMADAILRTLYRVFISKRNLLEWTTAADAEKKLKNDFQSYIKRMRPGIYITLVIFILVLIVRPYNLVYILPMMIAWALAPVAAFKVSRKELCYINKLNASDIQVLRNIARKTWAYFEDFAGEDNNYLPPDNFQEDPPNGLAYRTSPTNIGFSLISILAARDFGYISTANMIDRIEKTISTIERLETWKGHLYNWYDIKSLEPLRPFFVSSVDSGNLVSYLITLKQGIKEYMKKPIIDISMIKGIKDTVELMQDGEQVNLNYIDELIDRGEITLSEWKNLINNLQTEQNTEDYWGYKLHKMIKSFKNEADNIFPKIILKDIIVEKHYNSILQYLKRIEKENSLKDLKKVYINILDYVDKALQLTETTVEEKKNLIILKESITVAKENVERTLNKSENLLKRISKIIDDTDFSVLYDSKRNLFAVGYNIEDNILTNSYYDLLASEARITSYIAITRGEVPIKHWFKLGRALSIVDGYRGLVSWTGTIFEYLMPPLIMKNYKNTLLDETYRTVIRAQKSYGDKRGVPWGVSESGYYAFDLNFNYQYKAFGIPTLGLKRGLIEDIVISPYSTLMALPFEPQIVMENIKKLISDGLEGHYGFYEAADYTPKRVPFGESRGIVKSFMAHHLGMSFIALNNYLNENAMQNRFHSDPVMKAGEILLQEKIPLRVIITKEYKEKIEPLEEIPIKKKRITRTFDALESPLPKCHILSNNRYSLMITNGGIGYSKLEDLQITRWREDLTVEKYGTFIYLKEIQSGKIWSATYEPINKEPDGYKAIFSQDKAEFIRTDDNIDTHTVIIVSSEDNVEIRKVTLTNHNNYPVTIELTSYLELVITRQASDVAHPAFSNLFIRTEALSEYNSILASRRPRESNVEAVWAVHTVATDGDTIGMVQYETNRENFIGRGNNLGNPLALSKPLTNTTGIVIDPIMSLRRTVKIEPSGKVEVSFITSMAKSRDEALEIAKKYNNSYSVSRALNLAYSRSQVEASYLNLSSKEIETYQDLIPHIIFTSPIRRKNQEIIKNNSKGQPALWAYGISGDNPIVLVTVDKEEDADIVEEALKAHEYWKIKGLKVDLVILIEDKSNYIQPLQNLINEMLFTSHSRDMKDKPGGVFIRNANIMPKDDIILFYTTARIVLSGDRGTISSQINIEYDDELPKIKKFIKDDIIFENEEIKKPELQYFNGYGGFSKDGKEYIIILKENNHTPAPWINVISNNKFGFQVSESGSGFTWAINSRENKLTPWSNDPVSDPPGEVIYLRDEERGDVWTITPLPIREKEEYMIKHGLGYTKFLHNSHGINQELTMFVPIDDSVKINLIKLTNKSKINRKISFTYYIRPVLGVTRENTMQYIETEIYKATKTLLVKNSYNIEFPQRITFLSSSEDIMNYTGDNMEFVGTSGDLSSPEALKREGLSSRIGLGFNPCGAIQTQVELKPNEEKEIVFLLGQAGDIKGVNRIVNKYKEIDYVKKTLERVKENWNNILGTVSVKTPDTSMDILLNSWLLYQTISCRLWARSAFYQSGGAFGFRDQLQDAMNSIYVYPEKTRNQILLHCAHQFVEGDVQHWWHNTLSSEADKGIRTRFSDDLLWLPLATAEYVEKTNDFSILNEEVRYIEGEPLKEDEDEKYDIPRISSEAHLCMNIV